MSETSEIGKDPGNASERLVALDLKLALLQKDFENLKSSHEEAKKKSDGSLEEVQKDVAFARGVQGSVTWTLRTIMGAVVFVVAVLTGTVSYVGYKSYTDVVSAAKESAKESAVEIAKNTVSEEAKTQVAERLKETTLPDAIKNADRIKDLLALSEKQSATVAANAKLLSEAATAAKTNNHESRLGKLESVTSNHDNKIQNLEGQIRWTRDEAVKAKTLTLYVTNEGEEPETADIESTDSKSLFMNAFLYQSKNKDKLNWADCYMVTIPEKDESESYKRAWYLPYEKDPKHYKDEHKLPYSSRTTRRFGKKILYASLLPIFNHKVFYNHGYSGFAYGDNPLSSKPDQTANTIGLQFKCGKIADEKGEKSYYIAQLFILYTE